MRNLVRRQNGVTIPHNLFDDFMTGNLDATFRRLWNDAFADKNKIIDVFDNSVKYPKADAKETPTGIEIDLAVPGCEKEDIDIIFEENTITIKHEKTTPKETQDSRILFNELRHSSWSRSWTINSDVKEEEISATLKNGILTVSVPLVKPEIQCKSSPRKINISDNLNDYVIQTEENKPE